VSKIVKQISKIETFFDRLYAIFVGDISYQSNNKLFKNKKS